MPQIAQLSEDSWYLISQIFWLFVVFGGIYFIIGSAMLPKIEAVVDQREAKIADDLAAARAAHAEADVAAESYTARLDSGRREAQSLVSDAKDKAARDAEKKLKALDADLAKQLDAAEAAIADAKTSALAEVDAVAAEAARDLVARLSGVTVTAADAKKALKAVAHD